MIRRVLVVVAVTICALALASPASAQYQPGQPGFVLTPSTITPGGTVTSIGFGCTANQIVEVTINGQVVATTIAANDGKGSFSVTFKAPDAPGQYVITVQCGVTIISSILTVLAPTVTAINSSANLPPTGADPMPLTRFGLVLVAGGGLIVLGVRRRRET